MSNVLRKEIDDVVYEVNCKMITVKEGADVDIGTLLNHAFSALPNPPS